MEGDQNLVFKDCPDNPLDYIKILVKSGELFQRFIDPKVLLVDKPTTWFMAGSPGAGKTETAKNFISNVAKDNGMSIVRIDADEIRSICPGYHGDNADLFQQAVSWGVCQLYYRANKRRLNVLLDGTLANYEHALNNINIALKKNRDVFIFYVYQDPIVAWSFVKKREALEGRRVSRQAFISEFFAAKDNVNQLKNKFGNRIIVHLLKKDYNNQVKRVEMNISNIDSYVKFDYNRTSLESILE